MCALGNEKVNKVFEHSVPSNWQKPTPKSDRETREKFIKAKYEHKLFINPVKSKTPEKVYACKVTLSDSLTGSVFCSKARQLCASAGTTAARSVHRSC